VTRQAPQPGAPARGAGTLCVCRDPIGRSLLRQCLPGAETYPSAVEALLAAAHSAPKALVIHGDSSAVSGREIVGAFRRAYPGVTVYGVVSPEDEPRARSLLGEEVADYFVLPRDVSRLPAVLAGSAETVPHPASEGAAPAPRHDRWFETACRLADLALAQPVPMFRDGCRLITEALGAARGCGFHWSDETGRLDLAAAVGDEGLGADDLEPVRSAADRCLRTGETLSLAPRTPGAPSDGLLCVPVRDEQSTFGVLCLPVRVAGRSLDADDRRAAEALAGILARLYRAATHRQEYARLALRDVETGLLKAAPFLTYVESQIALARDRQRELALVLLEAEPNRQGPSAEGPVRLGLAVKGALAHGWEAGRLDTARYAVAVPASSDAAATETDEEAGQTAARRLAAAAGPHAAPGLSLRTATARYPRDGMTARALLETAEARLRPAPDQGP